MKQLMKRTTLATKIRYALIAMVVPVVLVSALFLFYFISINLKYDEMINTTAVSSEFSLDFKKDFDNETYLLVVEQKSPKDSNLNELIAEANRVVKGLDEITVDAANKDRLKSVSKYLDNLINYKIRIEDNLKVGNKYKENLEIYENDVQIVTSLVQDEMTNYIYYEIKELQNSQKAAQKQMVKLIWILGSAFIVLIIVLWYFSFRIPRTITRPISELSDTTNKVAQGDLSVRSKVYEGEEMHALSTSFNLMIDKINELLEQVTTEQVRLRKAEFDLLQSQINPHFLYNTLDAIVWLAESGDEKQVVSMVSSLSDFFRASLNQGKTIVTIKEELSHIRAYLEIQHTRYHDILDYEINVPEELYNYLIPKITIQPLIENALYHGIKNKRGKGTISVTAKKYADHFSIIVSDDGMGIKEDRLKEIKDVIAQKTAVKSDIYGVFNVNERIALDFGEEYGITIDSEYTKGTVVEVNLPYKTQT